MAVDNKLIVELEMELLPVSVFFCIEANCTMFRPVILNESWYEFSSMTVYRSEEICYSVG